MGQPTEYEQHPIVEEQNVQQLPHWVTEFKPPEQVALTQQKTFEQKAKDTILFIGENWGWGPLLIFIVAGIIGKKQIGELIKDPRQTLKKWANKL